MARKRQLGPRAEAFREALEKSAVLVAGDGDTINVAEDAGRVHVALAYEVSGYGPHLAAIYAMQNPYHGSRDAALQSAVEILEEEIRERREEGREETRKRKQEERAQRPQLEMFEEEEEEDEDEDEAEDFENINGDAWALSAHEFGEAIRGTDAEKFIDVYEEDREVDEERSREYGEVLSDALLELGYLLEGKPTAFSGYLLEIKQKGVSYDWTLAKVHVLDDARVVVDEENKPGFVESIIKQAGLGRHLRVSDE
jgi:hypothetical protein